MSTNPTNQATDAAKAASNHPLTSHKAVTAFLGVGQLAMLTLVVVASLRSLPAMAVYGLGSVTLYIIPAIFFLIPTALVAAELATGWKGGVYVWVREAFGNRWGFTAVWLQWIQNVVWYPTQIAFIAAALAFVFLDPSLANSGLYTAIIILALYWGSTLITLRGGNLFAKLGSWGGILGTLLPAVLLIVFGFIWLGTGEKSETSLEPSAIIPPFTGIASIVLIVSNVLAYAGMEVNAVHVNQMKDPGRGYPRSVLLASILILLVFILPTLAISIAVPEKDLGLTNGIMLAFQAYFDKWDLGWATAVVSALIAAGALASVITWIAGPSKGLLAAAETGLLPPALQKRNKAGVQSGILMLQGTIVTILAAIFVIVPNVSAAFVALIDMAAALYLIMYMLMFAAAIVLRRKEPNVKRTYRVPAMNLVAGVGFVACLLAFVLAFVPPDGFTAFPVAAYPWIVGLVIVVLGGPPLVFYALRKPSWDRRSPAEKALHGTHDEDEAAAATAPPAAGSTPPPSTGSAPRSGGAPPPST
ncbi:amino acid permease [Microbacterium sp. zg.Y1090]|uniref:amino acid permease n=1 Tax=Microbacterium wangruii TaxID=3049073 RepID=UPI00214CE19C|nr:MULTISPECIES: amino acid permease [unclassified Microbacterium]MCR2818210.1 amino acid permease [Microbacterium sp. zg.Y1090]MDL5486731.1 amino acid permease [Microbacterium sp. zg-Y1211]WIM27642.1 amino acid permease [Microbacterium sp. zg-Y1090]